MDSSISLISYSIFSAEISTQILLKIGDLDDLAKMCQTSKGVQNVGESNYFWGLKYRQDYGIASNGRRRAPSWKIDGDQSTSNGRRSVPSWKERYREKYEGNWEINTPISCKHGTIGRIDKGKLYMWGKGNMGQLGNGFKNNSTIPIHISFKKRIRSISCGKGFTGAITANDLLYMWGRNDNYQLGLGNVKPVLRPKNVKIRGLARKISCGEDCAAVMTRNNTGYIWGAIKVCGNTTECGLYKRPTLLNSSVTDITAGYRTIFLINSKFQVYQARPASGISNIINNLSNQTRLFQIRISKPVKYIQASFDVLNALTEDGLVYQLSVLKGYPFSRPYPKRLSRTPYGEKLPPISKISSSWSSKSRTVVITKDQRLFIWGENRRKAIPSLPYLIEIPMEIGIGHPARYVSVSESYVCVISDDGYINYW